MSVKLHRILRPSARTPSWTISAPCRRPTRSLRAPETGLNQVTRQAAMIAYGNVFGWMTLSIVLLAPLILIMRPATPVRQDLEVHAE